MGLPQTKTGWLGHYNRYVTRQVWSVSLLGGFSLGSPDGQPVVVSNKKSRALIAILALNRGRAITRRDLGERLWPDKPRLQQLQNLRKAVQALASCIREPVLMRSDYESCWLEPDGWVCDAVEVLDGRRDPGGAPLLPEMRESAFDEWRIEYESKAYRYEGNLAAPSQAIESATLMLQWIGERNPAQTIDFLRCIASLIPMISVKLIRESIEASLLAASNHQDALWASVQLATAQMWSGELRKGLATVRQVFLSHDPRTDPNAWTEAAFAAAMNLVFLGQFERAERLIQDTQQTLREYDLAAYLDRLEHARAHTKGYAGNGSAAAKIMVALAGRHAPTSAKGFRQSHASIFLLFAGRNQEAAKYLNSAKDSLKESEDSRLDTQVSLAEGYWNIFEDNPERAGPIFVRTLELADEIGVPIIMVHALEGLALVATDESLCKRHLSAAMRLRELHRIPLLPLDHLRLKSILGSSE